jgi:hypothetical protein
MGTTCVGGKGEGILDDSNGAKRNESSPLELLKVDSEEGENTNNL